MNKKREGVDINPLEYPLGYFDAQVRFAKKWSELTGEDLIEIALRRTALYRRLFAATAPTDRVPKEWSELFTRLEGDLSPGIISDSLYREYASNPRNLYVPHKKLSAFGYDYDAQSGTVKIHFTNPDRGERPLSEANMPRRREEFRNMLDGVHVRYPDVTNLMSATWLRSTSAYQSFSPPGRGREKSLMSPDMKFTGNSVWGQFMDANGNTNVRVYGGFIDAVASAVDLDELVGAFTYETMLASDPISMYYDFYGIK